MGLRQGDLTTRRSQEYASQTLSADGATTPIELFGYFSFSCSGSFGGGTIKLQKCFSGDDGGDDSKWRTASMANDGTPAEWTAAVCLNGFSPVRGVQYRFKLTGATSPSILCEFYGAESNE